MTRYLPSVDMTVITCGRSRSPRQADAVGLGTSTHGTSNPRSRPNRTRAHLTADRLPLELFFHTDYRAATALCHLVIPLISSKLFQNITRQTESCLQPSTALRMRRHPFCLSLRVVADARFELTSPGPNPGILPIDKSAITSLSLVLIKFKKRIPIFPSMEGRRGGFEIKSSFF